MRFYSTNSPSIFTSLGDAIMKSLPEDNGLFMPETIPALSPEFFNNIERSSFSEIAFEVAKQYLSPDLSLEEIRTITDDAINFPVPLVALEEGTFMLELFHGPTLAFKDVGARFMSRTMALLNKNQSKKLTILVATSGDTGSAVANGFYKVEGIDVIILYPSGKVSPLQEKQLTTLGENITALEVNGTFDDCQRMVKQAFLDASLREKYRLSSANSINIARLIPQSFYYIDAYRQLKDKTSPFYFSVPSGNFGNLTAGLLAKSMGLPVSGFIASTNVNNSVPRYLSTGNYQPSETIATISNAMDVGAPSNFARMLDLYSHSIDELRQDLWSVSVSDEETIEAIQEVVAGGAPMTASIARKVMFFFNQQATQQNNKDVLSAREQDVLKGLIEGFSYKMIAAHLNISVETVRTYIKRIYDKMHVNSMTEAVAKALKEKWFG